jgi:hypothetical protein
MVDMLRKSTLLTNMSFVLSLSKGDVRSWFDKLTTNALMFAA